MIDLAKQDCPANLRMEQLFDNSFAGVRLHNFLYRVEVNMDEKTDHRRDDRLLDSIPDA